MDIMNVVGARPNLVKIAPLLREMGKHNRIKPFLLHTGQHYDENLSPIFFRQMGIPEPDVNLEIGSGSPTSQTAEILKRIEPIFENKRPDLVLVVGDVTSTLAASLGAAKLRIPIAHVEAGLRSFDRTMPEEINRVVTDALADYLFATEAAAVENLIREGRPRERVYLVGNVMIDALQQALPAAKQSDVVQRLGLMKDDELTPFAILTLHRPSNVDRLGTLNNILTAVETLAEQVKIVFPVHPRTRQKLHVVRRKTHPQFIIIPPLGYLDFLCLLFKSSFVLTDSGGIQEETTALNVPCITLRTNTERPITVIEGTNELVGQDPAQMIAAARNVLDGKRKLGHVPALWDGRASERILQILLQELPQHARLEADVLT